MSLDSNAHLNGKERKNHFAQAACTTIQIVLLNKKHSLFYHVRKKNTTLEQLFIWVSNNVKGLTVANKSQSIRTALTKPQYGTSWWPSKTKLRILDLTSSGQKRILMLFYFCSMCAKSIVFSLLKQSHVNIVEVYPFPPKWLKISLNKNIFFFLLKLLCIWKAHNQSP